jgi:hypothetical protein
MVHVPAPTSVTVVPDTVQTDEVVEAKLTANPELALALTANGAAPNTWPDSAPNVMAWLPGVTAKLWLTGVAELQFVLPPCVAWIVHVPTATSVTVAPDAVHTDAVVEAKLTANAELAVALTVNGAAPNAWPDSAPNVIAWLPGVTVKLWLTGVAELQLALPPCVAWIAHVPTATSVTVPSVTVQTDDVVEAKLTANPELALALTVNGVAPNAWPDSAPNVIAWLPGVTAKPWLTGVAALQLALPPCVA